MIADKLYFTPVHPLNFGVMKTIAEESFGPGSIPGYNRTVTLFEDVDGLYKVLVAYTSETDPGNVDNLPCFAAILGPVGEIATVPAGKRGDIFEDGSWSNCRPVFQRLGQPDDIRFSCKPVELSKGFHFRTEIEDIVFYGEVQRAYTHSVPGEKKFVPLNVVDGNGKLTLKFVYQVKPVLFVKVSDNLCICVRSKEVASACQVIP